MISSSYIETEDIVYVNREGSIGTKDLLESIETLDSLYNHMDSLFVIEDIRNSTSLFDKDDYPVVLELLKIKLSHYKMVCIAELVNDPSNTALSFLFGHLASSLDNFYYSTFSTIDGAKKWLENHR